MFAYNAQPINFEKYENNIEKKKKNKNKTIKNKKVNAILNQINVEPFNNNDLVNFNPPPKPISMGVVNTIEDERINDNLVEDDTDNQNNYDLNNTDNETNDHEINVNNYNKLDSNINEPVMYKENYKDYVPYYTNASNYNTNNKELIEKLNYMIHLLEDNKNIKSESVTEDVILYSFLGVFIIFVIDSFSRATKYIR